jgi:hypothetical protein
MKFRSYGKSDNSNREVKVEIRALMMFPAVEYEPGLFYTVYACRTAQKAQFQGFYNVFWKIGL